jgi:MerR family mercuric resistance operon transcriptional regulator
MKIGDLARAAGIGVETVRYYQRRQLVRVPVKPAGATRTYAAADLARLRFIRRAQALGLSLSEIRALLRLSRTDCEDAQAVARTKLTLVRDKLADLQRLAETLESVLAQCARRDSSDGCPIIATLGGSDAGSGSGSASRRA